MLDIIQRVFAENGLSTVRIDGSVTGKTRQKVIDEFNERQNLTDIDSRYSPSICLLTTRACGYGITLTGADRVIIFDPSWNPAEDRQAVDRAFRIGQTKDVHVYRFIMASTVEEKMYEKQVFKDGVRVLSESGSSSRYFSNEETKELFRLGPVNKCEIFDRLPELSKISVVDDTSGPLTRVLGYSQHDLLYCQSMSNRNIPLEAIQTKVESCSPELVQDQSIIDLTSPLPQYQTKE
jgi:hypothetical protein